MSLTKSRYAKKPKPLKNQWRETQISEGTMADLIAIYLQQVSYVPDADRIERVIIGELADGQYPLTVAVRKGVRNSV